MSERIIIRHKNMLYTIRPVDEQEIRDGLVHTDRRGKGFDFLVETPDRAQVQEALEGLENVLNNPNLAVPDSKLSRMMGAVEGLLIPPVEIVGPKRLIPQSKVN